MTCNDDYGTSVSPLSPAGEKPSLTVLFPFFFLQLSRGSFTFTAGNWSKVDLFVQVNNPIHTANGRIMMFYNNALVMSHTNLQIRAANSVLDGGMFFSTFFGGSDQSWASPKNQVRSLFLPPLRPCLLNASLASRFADPSPSPFTSPLTSETFNFKPELLLVTAQVLPSRPAGLVEC